MALILAATKYIFHFVKFYGGIIGAGLELQIISNLGGVFSGIIGAKFDDMIFSYDYQLGTHRHN